MGECWTVGAVTVTKVHEITIPAPAPAMLAECTPADLEAHAWWSRPHFVDNDGNLVLSVHALVVESQGKQLVVDTCVGNGRNRPFPGWEDVSTDFMERFSRAGFDPSKVDIVVCTHLHFDHVGWNTTLIDGRWMPTFPNARYLFGRVEYDHWNGAEGDPYAIAGAVSFADSVQPIAEAGLMDLVESDHRVTDEVRLTPSPGHSPGHHCVVIESRGETAVITGDCLHSPIQFAHPDWMSVADSDHEAAAQTRKRLREVWAATPVLVIGTHFSTPTAGRVRCDERGWWFDTGIGN
jgi:glyoxylase-like metal-dependent hydrolase (beta-lactamase superfamily II)